jgi:hypothetical protein
MEENEMSLKQIIMWISNRPGELYSITNLLATENVNIRAISVAPKLNDNMTALRMVVDDPELAQNIFKTHSIAHEMDEVLAVETPDHPGGLNALLRPLKEKGININYLYPFIGRIGHNAILILSVDKPAEATKILKQNWINLLGDELYSL